jgi:hypothetical protein
MILLTAILPILVGVLIAAATGFLCAEFALALLSGFCAAAIALDRMLDWRERRK